MNSHQRSWWFTDGNEHKPLAFIGVYSRFLCNATRFHSNRALLKFRMTPTSWPVTFWKTCWTFPAQPAGLFVSLTSIMHDS